MSIDSESTSAPKPASWMQAAAVVGLLTVVLCLLFLAFGLPALHSGPHEVPIGVVGPASATDQVNQGLERFAPGGFKVTNYPDESSLRAAVLDRKIYGGLVLSPSDVTVLTATAASPPIAQQLTAFGANVNAQDGTPAKVTDLRPLPADDRRGFGLSAVALPMAIGGLLPAVLLIRRFPTRPWLRVAAASTFALIAGTAVAAILKYWFGSVDGDFWPIALGLSLGMAAISLTVLGMESLAGLPGLVAAAVLVMLVGNPLSGAAGGPAFLPSGWGTFGQLIPPGASVTLLRSNGFFDGAGSGKEILVLFAWVAFGLALSAIAAFMRQRKTTVASADMPPSTQ